MGQRRDMEGPPDSRTGKDGRRVEDAAREKGLRGRLAELDRNPPLTSLWM